MRNIFYEEKIFHRYANTYERRCSREPSVWVVETLALSCMKALHKFASLGIARRWRWSSAFFFPFLLDCLDTPFLATSIPSSILGRAYASLACNSMPGSKIWMHSELEGRQREETLLYCSLQDAHFSSMILGYLRLIFLRANHEYLCIYAKFEGTKTHRLHRNAGVTKVWYLLVTLNISYDKHPMILILW